MTTTAHTTAPASTSVSVPSRSARAVSRGVPPGVPPDMSPDRRPSGNLLLNTGRSPSASPQPQSATSPHGSHHARILAAAKACYHRNTAPDRPGTGYRRFGPVRLMVGFTEKGLVLLHIIADTPQCGHGARALTFLIHLAESFGLPITANAQPIRHGRGCLDHRSLLGWYLSFGFERIPESSMNGILYVPASQADIC